MSETNSSEEVATAIHRGQKYCDQCGWVEPARGFHPENGPSDHCPTCGYESRLFESKEQLVETDHENALLQTGRELAYL